MKKLTLLFTFWMGVLAAIPASAEMHHLTLRMLIWTGYAPKALRMVFQKEMAQKGIDVDFAIQYVNGPDEFKEALRKGKADIITPSNHQPKDGRYRFIKDRLTLPLDLSQIPNYKDIIPALQKPTYCTDQDQVYAIPLSRGPYGLIYNTRLVKEAPNTWNILTDPKYKGQFAMAGDFDDANIYVAALASGIHRNDIFTFSKVYTPDVRNKLKTIAHNAESFWLGIDQARCHLGLSLGITWGFCLPQLRALGEDWKMATPREGTTGWVDGFMIGASVKENPLKSKVAHAYLNFVLDAPYQLYVVRGLASAPVTVSINKYLTPKEIANFHLNDPLFFSQNYILWQPLKKKTRDGFRAMWQEATSGIFEKKINKGQERIK